MKEPPTFLALQNERAATGRRFILHTKRPAYLAEVYEFTSEEDCEKFGLDFFEACEKVGAPCLGSVSRKPWNGKHFYFAVISIYEGIEPTQKEADRLARITRRMADWYLYNILNENE